MGSVWFATSIANHSHFGPSPHAQVSSARIARSVRFNNAAVNQRRGRASSRALRPHPRSFACRRGTPTRWERRPTVGMRAQRCGLGLAPTLESSEPPSRSSAGSALVEPDGVPKQDQQTRGKFHLSYASRHVRNRRRSGVLCHEASPTLSARIRSASAASVAKRAPR